MEKIKIKICTLATLTFLGSTAYCMDAILYKGTTFGTSQEEFVKKFSSDNYICKRSDRIASISVCESTTATYGDLKPKTTSAQFHNNKLYGVNIMANDMDSQSAKDTSHAKKQLEKSIEEKYGKKLNCTTKKEVLNDYLMTSESCMIQDNKGQQLRLSFIHSENAALLNVSIHSIEGLKKSGDDYKKNKLSNM